MANKQQSDGRPYPRDIEAQITFLPTAEGGKTKPVTTGYFVQFFYDGQNWDAIHTYPDRECVNPGDSVTAYLAFLTPEHLRGKLYAGKTFEVREGFKTVATGIVTKVIELDTRDGAPLLVPRSPDTPT
jgi:translation elongation factor EF-Tu-like GTPase